MTSLPFRINEVVDNTDVESKVLPGPCRVIGFHPAQGEVWLIELPRSRAHQPFRLPGYLKAPFAIPLKEFAGWQQAHKIYAVLVEDSPSFQLSDKNLLDSADKKRRTRIKRDLRLRDQRYEVVKTVLHPGEERTGMLTASEALSDPDRLRAGIARAAEIHHVTRTSARHFVHLFWSGGSQLNALMPRYDRCGLQGHSKKSLKKLGRPSRLFKAGMTTNPGFVLDDRAKSCIAWGYALVNRERTLRDAYLLMSSRYYADHSISPDGKVVATLHPEDSRPTFAQFSYWGRKLGKKTIKEVLLGPSKYRQATEARGGSAQDQVCMVGQIGQFDGTSTDLYLCSLSSRLKKLPAMTRSILKDVRSDLIVGIYTGWDAPSPATALKTLLNAVDDKASFCARFGVTISPDEWPSFLPRTVLADNGELKGEEPTEAERQFGFGIEYAPVGRGDRKGSVETQHHTDHKKLDHKLPGTTKGKQRARGDEHAVVDATWNFYEYMRELIRHVLDHNNVEEVLELAPAEMLMADPPIKPTRLNIFKWLKAQNMMIDVPVDVSRFRAFTLPDWPAVLHKNGVYLEADVLGRTTRVPRLRYSSESLAATGLMSKVKHSGSPIKVTVKFDQEDLSRAWLVTQRGLIEMDLQVKDQTFVRKFTLTEWRLYLAEHTLRSDLQIGARDQYDMDRVLRREATTANARAEVRKEEKELGGRPSKQSLKSGLRANRSDEIALLKYIDQQARSAGMVEDIEAACTPTPVANVLSDAPQRTGMGGIMSDLNDVEDRDDQ